MQKFVYTVLFISLLIKTALGQDPHYSQFYATSLYLNPAYTGNTASDRITAANRMQWYNMDAKYTNAMVTYDKNMKKKNIGIGGMLSYDDQGGLMKGIDLTGLFSYNLKINEQLTVRAGFEAGLIYRTLSSGSLKFVDQYNNFGFTGLPTGEALHKYDKSTFTLGTGFLVFTSTAFLGIAVNHLNTPNLAFYGQDGPVAVKIAVHGGKEFHFRTENVQMRYGQNKHVVNYDLVFTPSFNFKMQGANSQLDLGVSTYFHPISVGFFYRGIPIKKLENQNSNNESLVFMIGIHLLKVRVGYSYDWTISALSGKTGGANEITLVYEFSKKYKTVMGGSYINKNKGPVPCPNF